MVDVAAPELLQPNSVKVPAQTGVPGCNKAICGCVKVEPFTVIFTIRVLATNLNHMPLLVPAEKQMVVLMCL